MRQLDLLQFMRILDIHSLFMILEWHAHRSPRRCRLNRFDSPVVVDCMAMILAEKNIHFIVYESFCNTKSLLFHTLQCAKNLLFGHLVVVEKRFGGYLLNFLMILGFGISCFAMHTITMGSED